MQGAVLVTPAAAEYGGNSSSKVQTAGANSSSSAGLCDGCCAPGCSQLCPRGSGQQGFAGVAVEPWQHCAGLGCAVGCLQM